MNGASEAAFLEGGARYLKIWIQKLSGKYQQARGVHSLRQLLFTSRCLPPRHILRIGEELDTRK
jgi:hypothetical protein